MEQKPISKLEYFRSKIISDLKEENKNNAHFNNLNPNELGEEDMNLYDKLMSNDLTIDEILEYQNKLEGNTNKSRLIFAEYVNNMLSRKFSQRRKS